MPRQYRGGAYRGPYPDDSPSAQWAAEDLARAYDLMANGGSGAADVLGEAAAWGASPDAIGGMMSDVNRNRMLQQQQAAETQRANLAARAEMTRALMMARMQQQQAAQDAAYRWLALGEQMGSRQEDRNLQQQRWGMEDARDRAKQEASTDYQNRYLDMMKESKAEASALGNAKLWERRREQLRDPMTTPQDWIDYYMDAMKDQPDRVPSHIRKLVELTGGDRDIMARVYGPYLQHVKNTPDKEFPWDREVARVMGKPAPGTAPGEQRPGLLGAIKGMFTGGGKPPAGWVPGSGTEDAGMSSNTPDSDRVPAAVNEPDIGLQMPDLPNLSGEESSQPYDARAQGIDAGMKARAILGILGGEAARGPMDRMYDPARLAARLIGGTPQRSSIENYLPPDRSPFAGYLSGGKFAAGQSPDFAETLDLLSQILGVAAPGIGRVMSEAVPALAASAIQRGGAASANYMTPGALGARGGGWMNIPRGSQVSPITSRVGQGVPPPLEGIPEVAGGPSWTPGPRMPGIHPVQAIEVDAGHMAPGSRAAMEARGPSPLSAGIHRGAAADSRWLDMPSRAEPIPEWLADILAPRARPRSAWPPSAEIPQLGPAYGPQNWDVFPAASRGPGWIADRLLEDVPSVPMAWWMKMNRMPTNPAGYAPRRPW